MHPIIALWVHPRSMSTAVERIMRERGDCTCFHEPFLYDYYVTRALAHMPMLDVPDNVPTRYEDIRDMLLTRAEQGPVFLKDMSYYVVPRIYDDPQFASRLTNTFLIRDPHMSILSYYRLDPDMTAVEIGIEGQWQHFSWLRNVFGTSPVVLRAERVQADPQGAMAAYWKAIGLEFKAEAFNWRARELPEDWNAVKGWHEDVASSSSIRPPQPPEEARAAFDAAAESSPKLRRLLDQHLPYFEMLDAEAI